MTREQLEVLKNREEMEWREKETFQCNGCQKIMDREFEINGTNLCQDCFDKVYG